jgi:hypothetical protein
MIPCSYDNSNFIMYIYFNTPISTRDNKAHLVMQSLKRAHLCYSDFFQNLLNKYQIRD